MIKPELTPLTSCKQCFDQGLADLEVVIVYLDCVLQEDPHRASIINVLLEVKDAVDKHNLKSKVFGTLNDSLGPPRRI